MTLDLINFVPNTKIKSSEVNSNFAQIGEELSLTQGTVEQLNQTVSVGVVPTGAIFWFPIDTPPNGYLICDGTAVSRSTYAALYTVIGTKYGTGDGTTTFNLPNLADVRFVKGALSAGYPADAVVGTHSHTASVTSWGEHQHYYKNAEAHPAHVGGFGSAEPGLIDGLVYTNTETFGLAEYQYGYGSHSHNITVDNAGSGDNAPKSLSLLPCIKY
jgi:hypothetical protein